MEESKNVPSLSACASGQKQTVPLLCLWGRFFRIGESSPPSGLKVSR